MQVDISCKDIEQQCKMIREEIFRHLTVIENMKSSWGQTSISSIFMALSITIGAISIPIGVSSLLQGLLQDPLNLNYIITTFLISSYLIFIIIFFVFCLKVCPTVFITLKFTQRIVRLHDGWLRKYMNRYRECCKGLSNNCSKEYAIYCLDLEEELKELEELVNELTGRR
jgi:hypothetical protein